MRHPHRLILNFLWTPFTLFGACSVKFEQRSLFMGAQTARLYSPRKGRHTDGNGSRV